MNKISLTKKDAHSMQADFRPFKAWRYPVRKVNLSKVIAPPYDVISPSEQEALYNRSPHNVVRLILGKETDFYEQARLRWEAWTGEGILVQDPRAAFYLYEQIFNHPLDQRPLRRLAVVGTLKLEEPGAVFRHESTFEGPKQDRLSLLKKVRTNLSPVFGLYQDLRKTAAGLLESYQKNSPLFEAQDSQGVVHRGWAIEKEPDQCLIREALRNQKILIADGHHRYETALEYRKQMRSPSSTPSPEAPFDFVLMALVETADDGLLVLPTHRVIRSLNPLAPSSFLERLQGPFDLVPTPAEKLFQAVSSSTSREKVFGLCLKGEGSYLLRLKNLEAIRPLLPKDKPAAWYEIEANLLNAFIFDVVWGVPDEKRQAVVEYTHFSEDASGSVREGKAEAAFLLRAPTVDTVKELAYTGGRMPQKTTYFYPKLASGLFFYHHE